MPDPAKDPAAEVSLKFPFVGIPSFLRAPVCTDIAKLDAMIAVLGVPTDEGSPFMGGSRFGPRALREHSLRFAGGAGYYDPETRREYLVEEMGRGLIADVGDAEIWPTDVVRSFANTTAMMEKVIARGALPVVIGGDHAITFPVARAFREPFHILHFDAHLDYMPFIHDLRFTNGHAFRHLAPLPQVLSLSQIGIRSLRNARGWMEDSIRDGNRVVTMREFAKEGPEGGDRLRLGRAQRHALRRAARHARRHRRAHGRHRLRLRRGEPPARRRHRHHRLSRRPHRDRIPRPHLRSGAMASEEGEVAEGAGRAV